MKIKGPKGPEELPVAEGIDRPDPAGKADPTFATRLAPPDGPTAAKTEGLDAVAAVAADLKAGRVTPRQALDRMVDLALSRTPTEALPAEARQSLRAELETLLREDPQLAARARRLGVREEDS